MNDSWLSILFGGGTWPWWHGVLFFMFLLLVWSVTGLSWIFLFVATDPNYPEQLFTGRVLFTLHSILLYAGNLWMLWVLRTGEASSGAAH
ncbi:MAG: hypothetical protein ABL970_09075 [Nitrospira sp.]